MKKHLKYAATAGLIAALVALGLNEDPATMIAHLVLGLV